MGVSDLYVDKVQMKTFGWYTTAVYCGVDLFAAGGYHSCGYGIPWQSAMLLRAIKLWK